MCDFPSWIEDDEGNAHFLVDKDAERMIADGTLGSWEDAVGHSAIRKVYDGGGVNCESRDIHPDVLQAIRRGEMTRMAKASGFDGVLIAGKREITEGRWLILGHSRAELRDSSRAVLHGSSRAVLWGSSSAESHDNSGIDDRRES